MSSGSCISEGADILPQKTWRHTDLRAIGCEKRIRPDPEITSCGDNPIEPTREFHSLESSEMKGAILPTRVVSTTASVVHANTTVD